MARKARSPIWPTETNHKTTFYLQSLSHLGRRRIKVEKIGLDAILDYGNPGRRNVPVADQVVLEGWRDDYDPVGTTVKKSGDGAQGAVEQASLTADADGCERFGPQIAHFEDEGKALPKRDPPSRKRAEQLRRRRYDYVRLGKSESGDRR